MFRKKRKQVEQAVDEATAVATDLAEKTMTIGPAGVALLLGAAALGAAATFYVHKTRKDKKAAR